MNNKESYKSSLVNGLTKINADFILLGDEIFKLFTEEGACIDARTLEDMNALVFRAHRTIAKLVDITNNL